MKNHLIISLLFLSVGFSQKEYNRNHITENNGVYIKKFSDEIVNGKVFQMFGEMKVPLGKMKDGKKEGKWIGWYPNGKKEYEGTFKDGEKDGLYNVWYENGQKEGELLYKDGILIFE
jgi:antitoxin component YwqK of YwqJK toxin-antitoxin module